ncbi:MAG TPA: response regulator [Methylocella sp.]|nr:response regulator [Methylocella sp.]
MDLIIMPRDRCVHIVDDEVTVRDALTVLLSTAEIDSRSYGSAEEYLESTQLTEPVCVLLDNQLPGISGIELLKRIVDTGSNSNVIMITGFGDVPTAVLAMKAGAFHFVQKPFDAEALLATVEEALSRTDKGRDVQRETAELSARYALLTKREQEVLALLLEGLNTKLIARHLGISARTIEHHRAAIMQKMQARSISQLVRMAFSIGHLDSVNNNDA